MVITAAMNRLILIRVINREYAQPVRGSAKFLAPRSRLDEFVVSIAGIGVLIAEAAAAISAARGAENDCRKLDQIMSCQTRNQH
jgi:hypothetical protein